MARLNIEVDAAMRKQLRIAALEAGMPMRQIVEALISRYLEDDALQAEIRSAAIDPVKVNNR